MALTRDELHEAIRPANFDPADVEVVGFMDTHPPARPTFGAGEFVAFQEMYGDRAVEVFDRALAEWEEELAAWRARNVELFGREFPGSRCEHCGAHIRWAGIVKYLPTGQHFVVGETCATERMELDSRIAHLARLERMAVERRAETLARIEARARFTIEHPAEAAFLFDEDRPFNDFFDQLKAKLLRYGELSERQLACVTRQVELIAKWDARVAEEAAAMMDAEPLTEGRREIVGTVVHLKVQDGYYGSSLKMLVKEDDGNKVWGTVPASLEDWMVGRHEHRELKGQRVKLTATVERSRDDEHFGFYKRPTKAEVV